ncbi:MAG: hypothetical protein R2685_10815 [Candidatus Nitrosocosmicus sp.]|nr:hypothetical protein [Candidatus Nitrosocosmicus sp.]
MTLNHVGNNWYIVKESNGDSRDEIPLVQKAVCLNIDRGILSFYSGNVWIDFSFGSKTDQLFLTWQIQMTLTNIGTTYKDIYPAAFDGLPLGLDTSGYSKLGIVVAWSKNSGTGRHDIRIVDNADVNNVLVNSESILTGMATGTRRYYDIEIPLSFEDFRGEVKLQAKSDVATDNPIFYGLWGYLIR